MYQSVNNDVYFLLAAG